jgi:hypothetical protein
VYLADEEQLPQFYCFFVAYEAWRASDRGGGRVLKGKCSREGGIEAISHPNLNGIARIGG